MNTTLEEEKLFRERTSAMFEEAHKKAVNMAPGTVEVWPGGATFTTIQAAVDSITDSGPQKQYQVIIGPGTYNEQVSTKEYLLLTGAGQDATLINQHGKNEYAGTIQAVTNGGISHVTINTTGGNWGDYCVGILILTPGQYHISAVTVHSASHNNAGINVRGISNNTGANSGYVIIGNSIITALAENSQSTPVAIEGFMNGFSYLIEFSQVASVGTGWGISTAAQATVSINDSTVTGQVYALYNSDGASLITATGCVINGPVSPGVIVN